MYKYKPKSLSEYHIFILNNMVVCAYTESLSKLHVKRNYGDYI